MFRDITIGQYYPSDSSIHALDPRTKLMGTLFFIVVLFTIKNIVLYLPCLAAVLILYKLAQIPYRYLFKSLRGILLLLVFTFIFRLLCTPGNAIANIWIFVITEEGIYKAVQLTARIALMILGASLLSYTSTPRELADGMEWGLLFLEKIKIPIHEMAVIVMIAFRFIPIMIEEINILVDAQAARGVEFEHCSIFKKCKNVFTLLIPLFLSTIRRVSDLAMAMEARGYKGDSNVSRMYPLTYTKTDRISYALIILFTIVIIALRFIL